MSCLTDTPLYVYIWVFSFNILNLHLHMLHPNQINDYVAKNGTIYSTACVALWRLLLFIGQRPERSHILSPRHNTFFFLSLTCSVHSSYVWRVIAKPDHSHGHIHTLYDSPGRGISPSHRPLPDNKQHSQETDNYTPVEFEPATPATECPQTYGLERAATGNGVGRHTPKPSGIGLFFNSTCFLTTLQSDTKFTKHNEVSSSTASCSRMGQSATGRIKNHLDPPCRRLLHRTALSNYAGRLNVFVLKQTN